MHFRTTPKIEIALEPDGSDHDRNIRGLFECEFGFPPVDGKHLLDVDEAERAVAWLRAHGVEQEPKAPERDTTKAIEAAIHAIEDAK